jgi:hypothetical protein
MDVNRLSFLRFIIRIGYGWSLIWAIPVAFLVTKLSIFFLFVIIAGFCYNMKSEYDEYQEFMDIVEFEEYDLYIPKIKASGQLPGYEIGTDCDIVIKNDTIYWFNYSLKKRGIRGLSFCLEFNSFERPVSIISGDYFNTVASWKITSRGYIQIKGKYGEGIGSFLTVNIFSHIDEVVKYLPKNLKKES